MNERAGGIENSKDTPHGESRNQSAGSATGSFDDAWLHDFYKECGREATLAYTTLNQMKNWAMVIAAAALSGLTIWQQILGVSNADNVCRFT